MYNWGGQALFVGILVSFAAYMVVGFWVAMRSAKKYLLKRRAERAGRTENDFAAYFAQQRVPGEHCIAVYRILSDAGTRQECPAFPSDEIDNYLDREDGWDDFWEQLDLACPSQEEEKEAESVQTVADFTIFTNRFRADSAGTRPM
ncbi:MAG: hypothetical protein M1319_02070 [Chloroflexi bacterium]|nr:hypothetical protein [Chloroflexota bacterium]